jgi:hypothetical protein
VAILSIVALVVIVGVVVVIGLLNREVSGTPLAQATATTKDPLSPRNAGWSVIKNDRAKLLYEVPPDWEPIPGGSFRSKSMPDITLYGPASLTSYQCEGNGYSRGGIGAGVVPKSDAATVATTLAKGFGEEFYSSGTAQVETSSPKQVTVNGIAGVQVDGVVTTTGNACLATKGKVSVLVIPGPVEYQVLVVNGDLAGGPATPPPPAEDDLRKIVTSARGY